MRARLLRVACALCALGLCVQPIFGDESTKNTQLEQLSSQMAMLKEELNTLKHKLASSSSSTVSDDRKILPHLKSTHARRENATNSDTRALPKVKSHGITERAQPTKIKPQSDSEMPPRPMSGKDLIRLIGEEQTYMPFDLDVPGQAFVSTGPYVGVPVQYSGSNLIINSPSVNTDLQLLGIRKHIIEQLAFMGGDVFREPHHSHLLLSGQIEAQLALFKPAGHPYTSDVDVTTVAFDLFVIGPSDWLLGFVDFNYDNSPLLNNRFRIANSRLFVNRAFITIGDLVQSPVYGTFGQFFIPFGTYSSIMISDTLPKLLARTKARALQIGFQQQSKDALYGAVYIFRGYSHLGSGSKINTGGVNLGFTLSQGDFNSNIGAGWIANLADSTGMQLGNGFAFNEKISHRVPAYNIHALFDFSKHIDFILEYVTAATRFNPNNMSYNGKGARPWAIDLEAAYSFYILNEKPSAIGLGFGKSHQALSLGIPLTRTSVVFNTSLLRNTLQSIEFRRDRNYAQSDYANGQVHDGDVRGHCTSVVCHETRKSDYALTFQFDYYF